jgi:hypothetical protein
MCTGGDFAGQYDQAGVHQRFGGDTREFVLREDRVQNRVGNLISDFIGMPLRDGFGGKEEVFCHGLIAPED